MVFSGKLDRLRVRRRDRNAGEFREKGKKFALFVSSASFALNGFWFLRKPWDLQFSILFPASN
jgi:hypothetical protein